MSDPTRCPTCGARNSFRPHGRIPEMRCVVCGDPRAPLALERTTEGANDASPAPSDSNVPAEPEEVECDVCHEPVECDEAHFPHDPRFIAFPHGERYAACDCDYHTHPDCCWQCHPHAVLGPTDPPT